MNLIYTKKNLFVTLIYLRGFIARLVFKRSQKPIQQWLIQVNATSKKKNVGNIVSFILLYKKAEVTRLNHEKLIYIIIIETVSSIPYSRSLSLHLFDITISVDNVKKLLISSSCVGVEQVRRILYC